MKYLSLLFVLCFALSSHAQKIPFQGKLTENDEPVTGTKNLTFTFESTDWTETHTSVSILDGFYSVVLGSINPLPDDLFAAADEASLIISIGEVSLSPITIYQPYKQTVFTDTYDGTEDQPALTVQRSGSAGSSFAAAEVIAEMEDDSYALYGQATGTGSNYAVYGYANGAGITNWGTFGIARGSGDGSEGYGTGSYNNGAVGYARDNTWGNTGVWGRAYGTEGVDNIGVAGWSEVNNGSDTILNQGVLGRALGPGINYGVHGIAEAGVENWAGWFDGNVNVNGELMINGEPFSGGSSTGVPDSIEATDVKLLNAEGKLRTHLNIYEPTNAGSLVLYGANDSTKVIVGSSYNGYGGYIGLYDSLRNQGARLFVNTKGVGNLYTYDANHKVAGWFGNQGNAGGFMQLAGYNESGIFTGATYTGMASWNNGLPYFIMEGSSEDPFTTLVEFGASLNGKGSEVPYFNMNSNTRVFNGQSSAIALGVNEQDFGFLELHGGNDRNWDVRAILQVDSIGTLGTAGRLELLGPLGDANNDLINIVRIGANSDPGGSDPSGASGEIQLFGPNTPNITMGGKQWENNDLPRFELLGSKMDNGYWAIPNIGMEVSTDGTYDAGVLNMFNTETDVSHHTVTLTSNGRDNGGQLILHSADASSMVVLESSSVDGVQGGEITLLSSVSGSGIRMYGGSDFNADSNPIAQSHIAVHDTDSTYVFIWGSGDIDVSGTISGQTVVQTSDQRLKENIRNQVNALEKVKSLRGVTFEWKNDDQNEQHIGFIAQEVEEVYPEMVNTKADGYKAVNYAVLVSSLVEAIKELDKKVSLLTDENAKMKAELSASVNQSEMELLKSEIASIREILMLPVKESESATVGQNR
ncbi:tail fiber domain-containing protein [Marinoscillum sp.]|uniref:tail fiber domain-containing protein n=1 Tax=Marinoscillum sp. TaxID=2024838 RepID=UPI003BAC903F